MKIIYDNKTNGDELFRLYREIFKDSINYSQFYFNVKYKTNQVIIGYDNMEQIVSMIHLNPYSFYFANHQVKVFYIVAVGTRELARRNGYMDRLLREALNYMYLYKCPFTFLMPAKEKYYLPYGFRNIYRVNQKRIPLEINNGLLCRNNNAIHIKKVNSENDLEIIEKYCSEYLSENYDVYAHRDKEYFVELKEQMDVQNGGIFIIYFNEQVVGTFTFFQEDQIGYIEDSILTISDCEFIDVLRNNFKCKEAVITKENNNNLSRKNLIMARIVNLESFLEGIQLRNNYQEEKSIILNVKDEIILQNNKSIKWTCGKNGSRISLVKSKGVDITIETLMLILLNDNCEEAGKEINNLDKNSRSFFQSVKAYEKIYIREII